MAEAPARARASRTLRILRPIVLVLVTGLIIYAAVWIVRNDVGVIELRGQVARFGPAAPIAFAVLLAITVPLLLPGTPFILAAGLLFGPWLGTLVAVTGQTAGGFAAYSLGHFMGLRSIEGRVKGRVGRFVTWATGRGTWGIMAIQATPLVPRKLLNYAMPAAGFRRQQYLIGTAVGVTPLTVLLVLTGDALFTTDALRDLLRLRVLAPLVGIVLLLLAWVALAMHVRKTMRDRAR